MHSITAGKTVSVRYILKNSRGEVLENTMDSPPVTYLHGSGAILPSLEAKLEGLQTGDARTLLILTEQGEEDFTVEVVIDSVRGDDTNQETVYNQTDCGPGCVCQD